MHELISPQKQKMYGRAGVILAIAGVLWFVVCFNAPAARWWNSLWFFFPIFVTSFLLSIIGRRSIAGVLGIIIGGLGLLGVGFLLYVG